MNRRRGSTTVALLALLVAIVGIPVRPNRDFGKPVDTTQPPAEQVSEQLV